MNRCVFVLLVVAGITGGVALIGCGCDDAEDDLSPLVVNTDAPLLLAEPAEDESSSARPATKAEAENPACFVCHANYTEEKLVVSHAAKDVGCTDCHGKHRLPRRTVRWNKSTGDLLPRDAR